MVAQYGLPTVAAYMGHVQDNAEESVRRVITALKDGRFELPLDNGATIRVAVTVDAQARAATIDFSGTSDQLPNNFNAPKAVTMAAVLYVFRTLVEDDIPLNAGCLKPLQVIVPEGCMLNPRPPAAVVAGNVETSTCVTNALYGALGVMAAGQCTMNNFTFPVRLESYEIRAGSGGAGRWRGGDGGTRRIRFLEAMTASILSNGRVHGAFGMQGGQPGEVGSTHVERADGRVETLAHIGSAQLQPGDVFVLNTPGGGGFGEPSA